MLRHVDLCSGIGGFSLGFEWAGLSQPILFCDTEEWCRKILNKHWPDVPIANDVKELANDPTQIPDCDILTAGYPCQPFSLAGERKGTEDDRHIWPYIRQIIASKRPAWCVLENVYGHISMGLDQVLADLEAEGYATRTFIVPACGVNAPHRRDRVWIVGHTTDNGCIGRGETDGREGQTHQPQQQPSVRGEPIRPSEDVAHTVSNRSEAGLPRQVAGEEGVSEEPFDSRDRQRGWSAENCWATEPAVGRVAHGIPRSVDRLKGLGNAIVPQIAMQIGLSIKNNL